MPYGKVKRMDRVGDRPIVVMRVPGIPFEVWGYTQDPDMIPRNAEYQGSDLAPGTTVYFEPGRTIVLAEMLPCPPPPDYCPAPDSEADKDLSKRIQAELERDLKDLPDLGKGGGN